LTCSSASRPPTKDTISRRRGSLPSTGSTIVVKGLSSPVEVESPAVEGMSPATSRAASMKAHTFSGLIASSGIGRPRSFPPSG
jgi:hypothetical protein